MDIVKTAAEDGLHLTGFLSEPKVPTDKIVVHVHGMAGSPYDNAWYPVFHHQYPQHGYAFLVGQHRGTGTITQFKRGEDEYPNYGTAFEVFEESVFDIAAWLDYARQLDYKKIVLQAHSFAPSKTTYYVHQRPEEDIVALVHISPVDMLGMTLAHNNHERMTAEATELVEAGNPQALLSHLLDGELHISAKTYLNLFGEGSNANIFCYTDRQHDWSLVNGISLPAILIGGTDDWPIETVAPSSKEALETLRGQFASAARVESVVYEGATHSFEGFEDRLVNDITSFLTT